MRTHDIFDFKRFGNYLVTDLKACCHHMGLDLITMSFAGLFLYLLIQLMRLFGFFTYFDFSHGYVFRIVLGTVLFLAIIISIGSKCFGYVTDKKAGSLYSLIPVSALEKTLSMLICCFLIPLFFLVVYLGVDALICLLDPGSGSSLISMAADVKNGLGLLVDEAAMEGFDVSFMTNPLTYLDDMMNFILIFVLGALCFKKHKIAMTILTVIAISMVTSSIAAPFIIHGWDLELWLEHAPFFYNHLVVWDTVMDLLGLVGLSVAIYFRLKKINY